MALLSDAQEELLALKEQYLEDEGILALVADIIEDIILDGENVSVLDPPVKKGIYLPVNPYSFAVPRITLGEMRRALPRLPFRDGAWPFNSLTEPDPRTGIVGLANARDATRHVYGLPHILKVLSGRGIAAVRKVFDQAEQAVNSSRKIQERDYTLESLVAVMGPAVFQTSFYPQNTLQELTMDVSVVVKGPQFEKAVNMYARKMISDLTAADQHPETTAVAVYTGLPIRDHKGGSNERSKNFKAWDAEELRGSQVLFANAIKTTTVSKGEIYLEMVMHAPHISAQGDGHGGTPEGEGPATASAAPALIRIRRYYCLHYKDRHDYCKSFAPVPLQALLQGFFFTKEAATSYFMVSQTSDPGRRSVNALIITARNETLRQLALCEMNCNHMGAFQNLLTLSLYDGHDEVLPDLYQMLHGLAGRYQQLREETEMIQVVVVHLMRLLRRHMDELEGLVSERQPQPVLVGGQEASPQQDKNAWKNAMHSAFRVLRTAFTNLRDKVWDVTYHPDMSAPYSCSESIALSAAVEYCLLAMSDESAQVTEGIKGMVTSSGKNSMAVYRRIFDIFGAIGAFLPQLRTLLETLELTVAWDVRRTLYETERVRQQRRIEANKVALAGEGAAVAHAVNASMIVGAQTAARRLIVELKLAREQQEGEDDKNNKEAGGANTNNNNSGGAGGKKKGATSSFFKVKMKSKLIKTVEEGRKATAKEEDRLGGWVECMLDTLRLTCYPVVDLEAEMKRMTSSEAAKRQRSRIVPEVIAQEGTIMGYLLDTRFDAVMTNYITKVMTDTLNQNPYPAFARQVCQYAVRLDLWTESDESLRKKLKPLRLIKIPAPRSMSSAFFPGAASSSSEPTYPLHSDEQARVFGTAPALTYCNADIAKMLLMEMDHFQEESSDSRTISIQVAIALRGIATLMLPVMARSMPSLIEYHVYYFANLREPNQEWVAHNAFTEYILRKVDGFVSSSSSTRHVPVSLTIGAGPGGGSAAAAAAADLHDQQPWNDGPIRYTMDEFRERKLREPIASALRSSFKASLHCIHYVPWPNEVSPDDAVYYVPSTTHFHLLVTSPVPSPALDRLPHPCVSDPGMLFESVFLDRGGAMRLAEYVQTFETVKRRKELVRLMWQDGCDDRMRKADDKGDFFGIYRAIWHLLADEPEHYSSLVAPLGRMMGSVVYEMYCLDHMSTMLAVLLSEDGLAVVDRARVRPNLLRVQTLAYINSVGKAIVSPAQVHFRGLVQKLGIILYRLYSALRATWGLASTTANKPTGSSAAGGGAAAPSRPSNLVAIMSETPRSSLLAMCDQEYLEGDVKNLPELLHMLRTGLGQIRQVVAVDLHENCPEVDDEVEEALGD